MASRAEVFVSDKRLKIQLKLAFETPVKGEACGKAVSRVEPLAAKEVLERPAKDDVMALVLSPENLKRALRKVKSGGKAPGVDGMKGDQLPRFLAKHWPEIRAQLQQGTYKPQPVRRTEIKKPDGGVRKLGIPTFLDRFIQQAFLQVLQSRWDPTFSESSFGFRPGRSQHQAIAAAQGYIRQGYKVVVDMDIEKFFDRVNHDKLMSEIAKRETDKKLLKLIRAYLNAGVMEGGLVEATEEGTPQGGPLSPLLSNALLDELDRELTERGLRFVRYADDCNVYVKSVSAGARILDGMKRFLQNRLKLTVNEKKSAVGRPDERKFLGFSFTREEEPRRKIAPQAIDRCKEKIRALTRRTKGSSLEATVDELRIYLTGWIGYFGYAEVVKPLRTLNSWIRHRLRSMAWKQWKTSRRRYAKLKELGVKGDLIAQTVGSPKGPWRIGSSKAMHYALPNAYFEKLGLPELKPIEA